MLLDAADRELHLTVLLMLCSGNSMAQAMRHTARRKKQEKRREGIKMKGEEG
jgi:hypothetical protein